MDRSDVLAALVTAQRDLALHLDTARTELISLPHQLADLQPMKTGGGDAHLWKVQLARRTLTIPVANSTWREALWHRCNPNLREHIDPRAVCCIAPDERAE